MWSPEALADLGFQGLGELQKRRRARRVRGDGPGENGRVPRSRGLAAVRVARGETILQACGLWERFKRA